MSATLAAGGRTTIGKGQPQRSGRTFPTGEAETHNYARTPGTRTCTQVHQTAVAKPVAELYRESIPPPAHTRPRDPAPTSVPDACRHPCPASRLYRSWLEAVGSLA